MLELELRRTFTLCGALAMLVASGVRAQETGTRKAQVINTVIRYRSAYLADSTRFDACSVSERIGGVGGVANPGRVLLGNATEGCTPGRVSPVARAAGHVVVVDSVSVSDTVARVQVTVRHGEYVHRETFTLVPHRVGTAWGIRDVRLWGAMQSSPPRRTPGE